MTDVFKTTILAATVLISGVSYAAAQSGPVDSKGQTGGTAHRGVTEPSGAKGTVATGDYSAAVESDETRAVPEPRGYGANAEMGAEPSAETSGPQDRR